MCRGDENLPGPLVWSNRYEIGVPRLDADHRELIRLINEGRNALRDGDKAKLIQTVNAIGALASEHFKREEAVLARIPGDHAGHEKEHKRRLDDLERLRSQLETEPDRLDPRAVCMALMDWFVRQAIGQDAKLKAYFGRRDWE